MSIAAKEDPLFTPEAYLERERLAEVRSEFLDGRILAMSGSSPEHDAIVVNLTLGLAPLARARGCRVFTANMKVRTAPAGLFSYPDLTIVCGEVQYQDEHRDVLTNPKLIVEVLCPSTEAFDRGRKRLRYQQIPTLSDYLLVAQDAPLVEHWMRQETGGLWLVATLEGLNATVPLPTLQGAAALSEIYEGVLT